MSGGSVREEWEAQTTNPQRCDPDNWERIRAMDADSERFLYLPDDEELLRKEAFVVVSPDDIEDLVENR